MKQISIFLLFVGLSFNFCFAQQVREVSNNKPVQSNYPLSITVQPIFLFNSAFKVDAELQRKENKNAFIGGLEIYTGKTNLLYNNTNIDDENIDDENIDDEVNGFGLNLAYKLKLKNSDEIRGFYFSPGITLRNFNINTKGDGFYTYKEGDVEYITYGLIDKDYNIKGALIYGNFGFQKAWKSTLVLDLYTGIAYKNSTRNDELELSRNYEKPNYGYNYNGYLIQAGVKIGFQVK